MKYAVIAAAVAASAALGLPGAVVAQTAKSDAKPAAKSSTAANTTKLKAEAKKKPQPKLPRSAVKAIEEVTPVSDDTSITLSEKDLEVAQRVFVGPIKCELGANVTITADEKRPGFFTVKTQKVSYRMHPVDSRTGAIRLEDPRAGAMWLQLGNKSMLMNQKIGERLADECQSPQQVAFADEMKKNPPKSILEPLDPPNKN
ncbi:hypothetical protein [uncultured Xylophilus sp.]|uniref:hypothetical protein n=1 Tax=uncultured Xylophilus sp. TaxID=296832 RepID=UPI0025DDD99D|nr:hypothetical protein [uncultured Xylophilus sp.]